MVETMLWLLLASILPMWVVEAEEWLSSEFAGRGYTGTLTDINYLSRLVSTFGKESEKWLKLTQEVTLHDAVFFLPGRKIPNDLKGWLWKNGHLLGSKPEVIHAVVGLWGELTPEARKQIADASQLSAIHIGLLVRYESQVTGLRGKKLAAALDNLTPSEAYPTLGAFGRMLEKAYGPNCSEAEEWFKRWEASLSVPESAAFPVDREWKEGAYTLRFVPRSNPERVFAGVLTNCCQHPDGAGADAAWYAQEAPNGGLLALFKEGQMVAQSFVWHPLGQPNKVCLDNVEALSVEMGDKLLSLFPSDAYKKVVLGGAYNDASVDSLVQLNEKSHLAVPEDLWYSDAADYQYGIRMTQYDEYVSRQKIAGVYNVSFRNDRTNVEKALEAKINLHGGLAICPRSEGWRWQRNRMTFLSIYHVGLGVNLHFVNRHYKVKIVIRGDFYYVEKSNHPDYEVAVDLADRDRFVFDENEEEFVFDGLYEDEDED